MTAKQELMELVEGLSEEAAERLLPLAKGESDDVAPAGNEPRQSNIALLLELMAQWRKEDETLDPAERARIDAVFENIEPLTFRLPEER